MTCYDVTIPMRGSLANWPGDAPYRYEVSCRISTGDSVNLGAVSMSAHTGTHADAPYHFLDSGMTIEQIPPDVYLGRAAVIDARGLDPIPPGVLDSAPMAPRVLFKTNAWSDHSVFPLGIPVMSGALIKRLAAERAVLVGVDVPSVDALNSKLLPNHQALGEAGVHILESLDLRAVPPGLYELTALPLALVGADGSPVRAVLRGPTEVG